ncbi:hypothetical protein [Microbacterium sp. NPDC058389]|uniref:hypothetical protein n=1 Tax=Microbacterium sp. NPDC058389 TaxID=3346475 RepID=UPI00364A2415
MTSAQYTFASHAVRGFAPVDGALASIEVVVAGQPLQQKVEMLTAAEVTGIAEREFIRDWPRDGSRDASPNYLAISELDSPEIPWLFSPPAMGDRIDPWIMLVVIDLDEHGTTHPLDRSTRPPRLTVPASELPDPTTAWMWAHVQLLGADTSPGDPARSLARLICPRRLLPDRRWLACVVPTLKAASVSALGDAEGARALRGSREPAWQAGVAASVTLPVYHSFEFATGPAGDFEKLVQALRGISLPPGMGSRRLRLSSPSNGVGMPQPGGDDVIVHGALRPVGEKTAPLAPIVGEDYITRLVGRLTDAGFDTTLVTAPEPGAAPPDAPDPRDLADELVPPDDPPRVGPPVYGQLAVGPEATASALRTPAVPPWLAEANLDPRLRVAAGLGARVARDRQEHLMEEAWRQVGDVLAANRLRRRGEYAVGTSLSLYRRWLTKLDPSTLIMTAAPVLTKIAASESLTVRGALDTSALTFSGASVELRRHTRRQGLLGAKGLGVHVTVPAVAAVSARSTPFTTRLPADGIDVFAAPSGVWDAGRLRGILDALVPQYGGVQLDSAAVTERLDAFTAGFTAFEPPTGEEVAVLATQAVMDLDRTMTRIGLLPLADVAAAVLPAAPPEPPPVERPPDRPPRRRGREGPVVIGPFEHLDRGVERVEGIEGIEGIEIRRQPGRIGRAVEGVEGIEIAGGLLDQIRLQQERVSRAAVLVQGGGGRLEWRRAGEDTPIDVAAAGVLIEAQATWASRLNAVGAASDALSYLAADPGLVTVTDGRMTIDTAAVSRQKYLGEAATTIERGLFDAVVEGTHLTEPVVPIAFGIDDARAGVVRDEIIAAGRRAADSILRPDLVGDDVRPSLAGGIAALHASVLTALDPLRTLPIAINSRIAALDAVQAAAFSDIQAAPDLSEPTYDGLAKISDDWILPGIDRMESNRTTLVGANREFISAFLVGMNHEIARELLWREYPTDQRGTYARQFWSHPLRRRPDGSIDRAALHDLKKTLGAASRFDSLASLAVVTPVSTPEQAAQVAGEDPLVLVVKGDLVRRYPSVIIQAGHTTASGTTRTMAGGAIDPDFRGLLAPDVLLVGFTGLTETQVRADAARGQDAAWWFFFSEHFGEPRFGLDDFRDPAAPPRLLSTWNDASWSDAAGADAAGVVHLGASSFAGRDLLKGRDGADPTRWGWAKDAGQQAWIMLQFPFRRGLPAIQLLPEKTP